MKIGIITYHRANNVGALLQNHALLEVITSNGADAETIDYKCANIEKANRLWHVRKIKESIKIFLHLYSFISRECKFNAFRKKHIKTSSETYSHYNILQSLSEYDAFWVGSDQVWNMNLNGNDDTYLLNFVPADKGKFSYAGSFGYVELPEKYAENTVSALKTFKRISVREDNARILLQKHGIESQTVLDPTLLLPGEYWESHFNVKKTNKKYVFVYVVAYTPELIEKARGIADESGCELWIMHYSYKKYPNCRNIRNASPDDFLNYIYNAQIVLCSSFHAVCFSILLHKKFYYALETNKSNNNSRITSLCEQLGLRRSIDDYPQDSMDYKQTDEKLNELRKTSLDYIKKALAYTL